MLHAGSSLCGALSEAAVAFENQTGVKVVPQWGPSGSLRNEIASGAKAEVFASASMKHPASLVRVGRAEKVTRFARNTMCALVRLGLEVTSETLLKRMLDPTIRLGTSTPKADPSGDYAFEVFRRAGRLQAGANKALAAKALQWTGEPNSPAPLSGKSPYGNLIASGKADIFLVYRTAALVALRENSWQQMITLPGALAVGADYGLTVIEGASDAAGRFAAFILSSKGQGILTKHGFAKAQ
jgi:ABC-type molybdate transport system substrate-binding protein